MKSLTWTRNRHFSWRESENLDKVKLAQRRFVDILITSQKYVSWISISQSNLSLMGAATSKSWLS